MLYLLRSPQPERIVTICAYVVCLLKIIYARLNVPTHVSPLHKFIRGEIQVCIRAMQTITNPMIDPHFPKGDCKASRLSASGVLRWRKFTWAAREIIHDKIMPVNAAPKM